MVQEDGNFSYVHTYRRRTRECHAPALLHAHSLRIVVSSFLRVQRDYQSRYLACDADGRVYTCKKKPECRFRIIRGATQYFEDMHGHYLSVHAGGATVRAEATRSDAAKFKICFPVVEGILQKSVTRCTVDMCPAVSLDLSRRCDRRLLTIVMLRRSLFRRFCRKGTSGLHRWQGTHTSRRRRHDPDMRWCRRACAVDSRCCDYRSSSARSLPSTSTSLCH
jgi:hypothetical protein